MKKNDNGRAMNGYKLMQDWFDYTYEQHGVKPVHHALYAYLVDLCNRLGWKPTFGLPTQHTMERLGIGNRNTYKDAVKFLESMGAIRVVEWSKNQHTSTQVQLAKLPVNKLQGNSKIALAIQEKNACSKVNKHCTSSEQAVNKHCTSSAHIDKQTNKQTNKQTIENFQVDDLPEISTKNLPSPTEIAEAIKHGEEMYFNLEGRLQDWVRDYDTSFGVWWLLYDKAVGQPKCEMEWYNLTYQDRVEALRKVIPYTETTPEKKYRKHPINWLQDKGWNDEIITKDDTVGIGEAKTDKNATAGLGYSEEEKAAIMALQQIKRPLLHAI